MSIKEGLAADDGLPLSGVAYTFMECLGYAISLYEHIRVEKWRDAEWGAPAEQLRYRGELRASPVEKAGAMRS